MNIAILSPTNVESFLMYFSDEEAVNVLKENVQYSAASAVISLVHSFIKTGQYVTLFTLSKNDFEVRSSKMAIIGIEKIDSYPVKFLWANFLNARKIKNALTSRLESLDVIHAHWTYEYAYSTRGISKSTPTFCTVRDWTPYIWTIESLKNKPYWSFRLLMNELVFKNKKTRFIANSPYTAALIKNKYKIDTPIIPNPIRGSFLLDKKRDEINALKILCISSSNDKRKNIECLLLAFQQILKSNPEAVLTLVGPAFTEQQLKGTNWAEKKLLNRVVLKGRVNHEELKELFDQTRIFVSPSLEETFGNTLLESMARKVPVIAGEDSGAIPHVLREGKAGHLCDVSNHNKLAQAILLVHENYEEAKKRADFGYELLMNEYLDTVVFEKHMNLYKEALTV